ncbi:cytochrome c oxidase assembly protein [Viridibacterium curvum]|uniref:Cytochrome c oxidase assembly protein CtaG n=1 Tax=Viridibacterium curvum TaxID=1101404 RepID=A0ABP9R065_9RHOO
MISDNRRLAIKLAIAACVMFGFGFALVPFYEQICEVTGLNNLLKPDRDVVNTQVDTSRSVMLQFDSNVQALAWRFKPLQTSITVHPGQMVRVDYEVENTLDRAVTGQAVPSYTPALAGTFVKKLECFCFSKQTLGPREKRVMPVVFTLDAGLPADVTVVTLSYTFFEVPGTQG